MEKRTPHYVLQEIQDLIRKGDYRFTKSSIQSIRRELEITEGEALQVIFSLTRRDFNKSMTAYQDHTKWHDVYRPEVEELGKLYIKLQLDQIPNAVIISFKHE